MSQGQGVGVRDGQMRPGRTKPREVFAGGVVKLQLRRPAAADDFEVAPEHTKRVAGADGLHASLLRGEPSGQMRRRMLAAHAVGNLCIGEDSTEKPVAVSLERLGDASNLGGVHSQADDRHDPYSTMPAMLPAVGDDFEWAAASWGHVLRARALAHVPHGWTTRQLVLRGGLDEAHDGWEAIARTVGLVGPESLVRLRQVHGAEVYIAGAAAPPVHPSADIVLTDRAERVVAVQVADCAPVLVGTDDGRVVAAAHAGWRGTAADVAGVSVRSLSSQFGTNPAVLSAAIGPCIGPCCYEVGDELIDAFATAGWGEDHLVRWFARRDGKLYLDVWQANADQLVKAGVSRARVHMSRLCTACHMDWFNSYRREGADAGRLAGFIRPQPFRA